MRNGPPGIPSPCSLEFGNAHGISSALEEQKQARMAARMLRCMLCPWSREACGWLRTHLEREASQLASKLPEVSSPFNRAYWAGEETAESWWPWNKRRIGWTAPPVCRGSRDQRLMELVRTRIDYTLAHASEDGYLGQILPGSQRRFHRWPHALFFRALSPSPMPG